MCFQSDAKDMVCNIGSGWPGVRSAHRPIDLRAGTTAILYCTCERVTCATCHHAPGNKATVITFLAFSTIEMGIFAWRVHVYLRSSAMLIFTA